MRSHAFKLLTARLSVVVVPVVQSTTHSAIMLNRNKQRNYFHINIDELSCVIISFISGTGGLVSHCLASY